MTDKENIGHLISEARKAKGLTQQELAQKLNISDKAISKWETGKNLPDLDMLRKIEEELEIKLLDKNNYQYQNKLKILFIIIGFLVLLLIYFISYYLSNYNQFNIYTISLNDEQFILKDSYLITSKEESILNLGAITNIANPVEPQYNISIYYQDKEEKIELLNKPNYKYLSTKDSNLLKELLPHYNYLYIKIEYSDFNNQLVSKDFKLKLTKTSSNNKIIYTKTIPQNNISSDLLSLLKNNNYKKTEKNIYLKEDEQSIFTLNINNNLFYYEGYINNYKVYAVTPYRNYNRYFNYVIYDQNNQIIEHNMLEGYNDSYQFEHKVEDLIAKEVDKLLT